MLVGAPFERVGIDRTGTNPKSRNSYVYILTYVDHVFNKWADAVAQRNKETSVVAMALVDKTSTKVALPLEIMSDQGKEFDIGRMQELYKRLEINTIKTSA